MYFGSSPEADFFICSGLGVAAACCLLAIAQAVQVIEATALPSVLKFAMRITALAICGGAMLSVCVAIGGSRDARDPDSILGFVFGSGLTVVLALMLYKLNCSSNDGAGAGLRSRGPADR